MLVRNSMILVVVPHGPKLTGVAGCEVTLAADPPMTMSGKAYMLALVPRLRAMGPYQVTFCSLMDRACGSMCTVVKRLNIKKVTCIEELGHYGNLDADGTIIPYPGHERDDVHTWQGQAICSMAVIYNNSPVSADRALVFTHRPILAGLVAVALGVTDTIGIQTILDQSTLAGNGFRKFEIVDDGTTALKIRLLE
ncbi:MAG: hypothetical protein V4467_04485 [Patescibacteria group bacterium]